MSGEPSAKRDLAEAILKTADEAWSVVYDWVKEKIGPGEEEEESTVEKELSDLRVRISLVNEAWNKHQQKHDTFAMDQRQMWRDIEVMNARLDALNKQEPPKPPTMIEKLEIQKLQHNAQMHEKHLSSLLSWKDYVHEAFTTREAVEEICRRVGELERKEAANGIAGSGAHAQQLGIQGNDGVQSVRIWCQTSGVGCDSARDWIAKGDGAATCQAGPDPSVEVGGPAPVQPGGGEHVPAADGGDKPN